MRPVGPKSQSNPEVAPRPFLIELAPRPIDSGEWHKRQPSHRLVLEPLLKAAHEVCVHGKSRSPDDAPPMPPAAPRGPVSYLDVGEELVKGWESFWNATGWSRGSVSIKVDQSKVDWAELFSWTQYAGLMTSRAQLTKSMPAAAVSYGDVEARGGSVVVTLSASNGIQWGHIWSDVDACKDLHVIARTHCRRFVRWVEHGKFDREIVYDREPYTALV